MNPRIRLVQSELSKRKIDCLVLTNPNNISYLTGIRSRDSYLVVSNKKNVYITDSRYTAEAKKNLKGCSVAEIDISASKSISKACIQLRASTVGFEDGSLVFASYNRIRKELGKGIRMIPSGGIVEKARQIKAAREIELIRKATEITVKAFDFIEKYLRPGLKEIEVAAQIERFIRLNGAYSSSFDIIVASGANSSFPHHLTSGARIKNNDIVLIDMGVDYCGLKSDLTRVFFLGKINSLQKQIYDIVQEAQKRAIEAVKPAVFINKIDAAARHYIASKGFGGFFTHASGHGIGLEVHEAPRISAKTTEKLETGMVFTIEPAVYIPGKFGIRIEDMCLVTRKGVEVISGTLNQ